MPDLGYDPKNPADLLGQPIKPGDIVAWGTNYGRSAAICICVIDKIRFAKDADTGNWRVRTVECERHEATKYTLRLRPLKGTNSPSWIDTSTGDEKWSVSADEIQRYPGRYKGKTVTVQLVKNVVKLNVTEEDVMDSYE